MTKRMVLLSCAAMLLTASVAVGSGRARAALPFCQYDPEADEPTLVATDVVVVDCLPTVADCAQRRAPASAVLRNSTAFARCEAGEGNVLIELFVAGTMAEEQGTPCGVWVERDVLVYGGENMRVRRYLDPNECPALRNYTGPTGQRFAPATEGTRGVVASPSSEASAAGLSILDAGGNAVDAAAATVFALTATSPAMCGIGGGGFLVAWHAASKKVRTLDFREAAPAAMQDSSDLFLKEEHTLVPLIDEGSGPRVVGVPGVVAGMDEALRALGSKSIGEVLQPAIRLARASTMTMDLANLLVDAHGGEISRQRLLRLRDLGRSRQAPIDYGEAARILLVEDDETRGPQPQVPGDVLRQPELAADLTEIATHGPSAFYDVDAPGSIAEDLVDFMARSRYYKDPADPALDTVADAGLLTADDLRSYRPIWRRPLSTTYGGHRVWVPPPPNSGGIQLLEMLNILESPGRDDGRPGVDAGEWRYGSSDWAHHLIEAAKIAMSDRDAHVGDPAFVDVPVQRLIDPAYGTERRAEIDMLAKSRYPAYGETGDEPSGAVGLPGGMHTAHVSVIDRKGNAVAVTCSIGQGWGSGLIAPGTGFFLNNELTDFVDAGDGSDPNEPAPGKRPRSNMAPFVVVDDRGTVVLAGGGAGGGKIPIGSLHMIVNVVDHRLALGEAVDVARFHVEWTPWLQERTITLESPRLPLLQRELEARGHKFPQFEPRQLFFPMGLEYDPGGPYMQIVGERVLADGATRRSAASDPRFFDYGAAAQR